ERRRTERSPVARGLARLWGAAWPGHPYARTGSPPAAGGAKLTVADVEAWREARYGAANAVLILTRAFDRDRALAPIRTAFESRAKGGVADVRTAAPKPAQRASERIAIPGFNGGAGPRLCFVGWRGPGAGDADAPALELLASCLGGGSAARIPASLV